MENTIHKNLITVASEPPVRSEHEDSSSSLNATPNNDLVKGIDPLPSGDVTDKGKTEVPATGEVATDSQQGEAPPAEATSTAGSRMDRERAPSPSLKPVLNKVQPPKRCCVRAPDKETPVVAEGSRAWGKKPVVLPSSLDVLGALATSPEELDRRVTALGLEVRFLADQVEETLPRLWERASNQECVNGSVEAAIRNLMNRVDELQKTAAPKAGGEDRWCSSGEEDVDSSSSSSSSGDKDGDGDDNDGKKQRKTVGSSGDDENNNRKDRKKTGGRDRGHDQRSDGGSSDRTRVGEGSGASVSGASPPSRKRSLDGPDKAKQKKVRCEEWAAQTGPSEERPRHKVDFGVPLVRSPGSVDGPAEVGIDLAQALTMSVFQVWGNDDDDEDDDELGLGFDDGGCPLHIVQEGGEQFLMRFD